ncbi:MAG TPA: M3 family metallopeptidase, partial [Oscillospiraceae bacterium]|nr:M3 family metallopeptidase [Oscillospiraceae bacterium]
MSKICPNCRSEFGDEYQFCPNCGSALPDRGSDSPSGPAPFCCPNCGETVLESDRFCRNCGTPVFDRTPEPQPSAPSAPASPSHAEQAPAAKKKAGGGKGLLLFVLISMAVVVTGIVVLGALTVSNFLKYRSEQAEVSQEEPYSEASEWPAESGSSETDSSGIFHSDTHFSDYVYTPPDFEAISENIAAATELIETGGGPDEFSGYGTQILEQLNNMLTMYSLLDVYTSLDYTNDYYQQEYLLMVESSNRLDTEFNDMIGASVGTEYEQTLRDLWGDEYFESCLQYAKFNSDEIAELSVQEAELVEDYDVAIEDTSVVVSGRSWTMDDLGSYGVTLSDEEYYEIYDALCKATNEKTGPIFQQLVGVRNKISQALGYDSYADYAYDLHGRDYSPEDAADFQQAAKTYIAPLYEEIYELSFNTDYYSLYSGEYDSADLLPKIYDCAAEISPKISTAMNYMLTCGLYDIEPSETKLSGGFTTYFTSFGAPFLFDNWDGDWSSVSGFTHELGHYTSYYGREPYGWDTPDSTDVAEIDSQTLELLLMNDYDSIFGEEIADAARMEEMLNVLHAILSGCMEDEFQQRLYANPNMTLDEINALYYQLAEEYGLTAIYHYSPEEWVFITHTFESPFYYISYAASMVPSAEIFFLSQEDEDGAVELYEEILGRENGEGFLELLA